jgi:hypothetical protein
MAVIYMDADWESAVDKRREVDGVGLARHRDHKHERKSAAKSERVAPQIADR